MKENKKDLRRQWPTGILTEAVIKQDVRSRHVPAAIGFTVAAVLFGVGSVPAFMTSSQVELRTVLGLAGLVYCAYMAYRKWSAVLTRQEYEIREDVVTGKRIEADIHKENARQSDLTTRIPILELENHGMYKIDAEQIHNYYIPLQLVHDFQEGEAVYMVYDRKTKKLLRLYRKKYWSLPEE